MAYKLNIDNKHKRLNDNVNEQYKILKKCIGREIFSTFKIWLKDESGEIDYYTANKLYNNIINDDIFIKLKYRLHVSGINAINDSIVDEYSRILQLETENENLKRELNFYKNL